MGKCSSCSFDIAVLAFMLLAFMASCSTTASPVLDRSAHVVKDRHPVPSGWSAVGPAPAGENVHLRIALKQGRFQELEGHLHEVSDPSHHRYGRHLSADEVRTFLKPTVETDSLVREWLRDYGIEDVEYSSAKDWIHVHLPIHHLESLLNTTYYVYRHESDGATALRTPHWSLPLHLHDHIDGIYPSNAFFRVKKRPKRLEARFEVPPLGLGISGDSTYDELAAIDKEELGHMEIPDIKTLPADPTPSQACNWLAVSPLCLRTLYGTLGYVPQAPEKVSVGLVNYLDHVNNVSDIEMFLQRYRPDAVGAASKIKTEIVAHGSNNQDHITEEQEQRTLNMEGDLNAETVIGISHPIPVTAYNIGGKPPFQPSQFTSENDNEPYLAWLEYVLAQQDLPQIVTTSYADEEQTVPYWYAKRVCEGFAQLGARGVSVLFASGDHGVGADEMCYSNDESKKPMFLPEFPASCPYVTTVGGTRGWDPEIVVFDARRAFVAGGGFSNYFPRPRYQKKVVDAYVHSLGTMYDGLYNKTGRGYPDISLRAYHYITVWNGGATIVAGTSAASPAVAGIFALVNDALAAEGKPPLGWLNPWIYSGGFRAFTDVIAGSNPGCNTAGFPAKKGWDASSGFGTPRFPTLKALALERRYRDARPWYMEQLSG